MFLKIIYIYKFNLINPIKLMKKILMLWSLVMLVQLTFAQGEGKTNEEKATHRTSHMTKELSLSTDQQSKVKAIILDKLGKMDVIRAKYASATDKSGMHQEVKVVRDQEEAELKRILTPAQITKYDEKKEEKADKKGKKKK
jgi:protein CpxP